MSLSPYITSKLNLLKSGFDYQADPILKVIRDKSLKVTSKLWNTIRARGSKELSDDFRKLYDIEDETSQTIHLLGDSWFFGLQHKMPVYRQKVREIIRSWKDNLQLLNKDNSDKKPSQ